MKSNRETRKVKAEVNLHLVFITKADGASLSEDMQTLIVQDLNRLVLLSGHQFECVSTSDTHVHFKLEADYKSDINLSKLINSWKGVSSRTVAKEYGTQSLWSPSFYVGSSETNAVAFYKN